jgi:DNA primase
MASSSDWETAKERIRDRIDFVGLVEEYVTLEERGKGYWGLCPFHTEDTPSFSVTPSMGIYKCFGCGAGGDVFDFFMKIENCEFKEALRRLADRADVDLPSGGSSESSSRDDRLRAVTNYAAERYREAFWSEVGKPARRYMNDRGYTEETLEEFDVGFAPEGWRNLVKALKRDDYDLEDARDAGLVRTSDSGRVYDAFRGRVMFPIKNRGGDVVAFGGRILDPEDEESPKYLNSQDTPIFHKRQLLYGFSQARSAIRDSGRCLLMEGYTDVMMCHQEDFKSAVATLGTALTEQHVQRIKRTTDEVVLVYDGDRSGRQAARDGGEIALEHGLDVTVALLPEGRDPADLLTNPDESFESYLDERQPFLDFFMDWMIEEHSLDSASDKESILREFYPLLKSISSQLERNETVGWLADRLKLREEVVRGVLRKIASSGSNQSRGDRSTEERDVKTKTGEQIEEIFFQSLVLHPERFEEAVEILNVKDFAAEANQDLMRGLKQLHQSDRDFGGENWMDCVDEEYQSYLAGLLSYNEESRLAEGTDPVNIARKMKRLDSAQRERVELMRELAKQERNEGAGELDEAKKVMLEEAENLKFREQSSAKSEVEEEPSGDE